MVVFSFFRATVADYAAWLLAMTNEISLSKENNGSNATRATIQIVSDNKLATGKIIGSRKATQTVIKLDDKFKKPVVANLPKTKTPVISFDNDFPEWDDASLTLFTPLRKYDGTLWGEEKTEIKSSTDGKKLYLICRFYDKKPDEAVTEHTENSGGKNAWKDDSIELFLMKDRNSKFYCQYIVSVSGKGCVLYNKNTKIPNRGTPVKIPKSFIKPRYSVDDFDGGFEIEMSVALSNIGINKLNPGDSLLMQVVRNYRGQGNSKSVTLHLFPVYIYADKRLGVNNHDRRAFQQTVVKQNNID
jgi:hypothetical protein